MLRKLRSPKFKSRTRKIDYWSFPKAVKPNNKDGVKRELSLIPIHETFQKCNSKSLLFLWWGLILLLRDILNSTKSFTFQSYWTDGHRLYWGCFRHGACSFWANASTGSVWDSCTAPCSTSWNDTYLHSPTETWTAGKPICLSFNEKILAPLFFFST